MKFHSNGKLLLTGEYLVLEGATALALPTNLGQSLEVRPSSDPGIRWTSLDQDNKPWLQAQFNLVNDQLIEVEKGRIAEEKESLDPSSSDSKAIQRLQQLLGIAHRMNPELLNSTKGLEVITKLEFDRLWGLGSSSTLVNNLAQWFSIDPYELLEQSFGGSGYDIASAQHDHPITYTKNPQGRSILSAPFDPPFKDQLFFVHQNHKQDTRLAIAHFRKQSLSTLTVAVEKITSLTQQIIHTKNLQEFEMLLDVHESVLSGILNLPKLKVEHFKDYPGSVKSLGGWGGDFFIATGGNMEKEYFREKGYHTILDYTGLVR